MRFLVDACLSPQVAQALTGAGNDAVHVRDYALQTAPDQQILDLARQEQRVLITADTDFGLLLARHSVGRPSVILFRRTTGRRPRHQAQLLLANLPALTDALEAGSLVVIEQQRLRIRSLPLPGPPHPPITRTPRRPRD